MKLRYTILPLLMGMAFAVCEAAPINYTINFSSSNGGPLPTAGSFTYDSATPTFSNFNVTYLGTNFDLTASANAPNILNNCGVSDAANTFALLTKADPCGAGSLYGFIGSESGNDIASAFLFRSFINNNPMDRIVVSALHSNNSTRFRTFGDWTVTQDRVDGVPEPASILVTISGGVALLLLRRRAKR